jgi:hypothetical protein
MGEEIRRARFFGHAYVEIRHESLCASRAFWQLNQLGKGLAKLILGKGLKRGPEKRQRPKKKLVDKSKNACVSGCNPLQVVCFIEGKT